jgi:hypothetical protein
MNLSTIRHVRTLSGKISVPDVPTRMSVAFHAEPFDQNDAISRRFGEAVESSRRYGKNPSVQTDTISPGRVHAGLRPLRSIRRQLNPGWTWFNLRCSLFRANS